MLKEPSGKAPRGSKHSQASIGGNPFPSTDELTLSLDDSGWAWFIPLHDGTTSIGVVVSQKRYQERCKTLPGSSTLARYQALLPLAPNLIRLVGRGTLVSKASSDGSQSSAEALVRSAADFSYSAPRYAGDSFRIVGDAGGTWDLHNL